MLIMHFFSEVKKKINVTIIVFKSFNWSILKNIRKLIIILKLFLVNK